MGINRAYNSKFGRRRDPICTKYTKNTTKRLISESETLNFDVLAENDFIDDSNLVWFYDEYNATPASIDLDLAAADEKLYEMGILYDTPPEEAAAKVDPFPGIEVDRDWDMVSLAPADGEGEWDVISTLSVDDDTDTDDWDERSVA